MGDFTDRYDELYVLALRAGRRVLGDTELARDVASETLARAYSRWGRVENHCQAWVTRVAVNLALDTLRRKKTPLTAPDPSAGPSPDRVVLAAELAKLPRRQREALVLRFLMDLDEETTAQLLGVSIGTVHTHVVRGLARVRRQLPPDFRVGVDLQ